MVAGDHDGPDARLAAFLDGVVDFRTAGVDHAQAADKDHILLLRIIAGNADVAGYRLTADADLDGAAAFRSLKCFNAGAGFGNELIRVRLQILLEERQKIGVFSKAVHPFAQQNGYLFVLNG